MKYTVHNLDELQSFAQNFITSLKSGTSATVVALKGDLGSGKTSFTQQVAKILGVTEAVTSPTFVIEKIYKLNNQLFDHLIHIDAYRLESGKELENLGWKNIVSNPGNCIFIEWPEKIADLGITFTATLSFTFINETTREIEVE